jgi:hypothetical protein
VSWREKLAKARIGMNPPSVKRYASFGEMKSSSRILHTQSSGIAPEEARDVRARAWAYVVDCFNSRNGKVAAEAGGPGDVRKGQDAHSDTQHCI